MNELSLLPKREASLRKLRIYYVRNVEQHTNEYERSSKELKHSATQSNLLHHASSRDDQEISEDLLNDFDAGNIKFPGNLNRYFFIEQLKRKTNAWKRIAGINPHKGLDFNQWLNDVRRSFQEKEIAQKMLVDFLNGELKP